jgi:TP901 family phage tail tape measure protein
MDTSTLQIIIAAKDAATAQLAAIDDALKSVGVSADKASVQASAALDKLDATVTETGASMVGASDLTVASMARISAASEEAAATSVAAMKEMDAKIAGSGGGISKIQAGMIAIGLAAAVYIGGKAVQAAGDYQASLLRLVTAAGETQSGLKVVSDGLLNMSVSTGTSLTQLSDSMFIVEKAGHHGADGLQILTAAAQGAKAENADVTTVTDAVTSALQDYHLKASDAAKVTSELVTASGEGKTSFQDFTGSLHNILPIASALNVNLADVTGVLATITVHGVSAQQATENMADAMKHLAAPTSTMTDELGQLGIKSGDLSTMLSTKGLSGTLLDVSNAIQAKLDPSGKIAIGTFAKVAQATDNANTMLKSMPANMQALANGFTTGQISLKQWRLDVKALPADQANLMTQWQSLANKANGFSTAVKGNSPVMQNYTQALSKAMGDQSGMNVALQVTGENADYMNGAIKKVAGTTTEAGNNVKGWAEIQSTFNFKQQQAKEALNATFIAVGQALLPAMTTLMGIIVAIVGPITAFVVGHRELAAAVIIAVGAVGTMILIMVGLAKATAVVKGAMDLLGISSRLAAGEMAFNPVILAIMAVIVVVVLLISFWPQISKAASEAWSIVMKAWQPAGNFFTGVFNAVKTVVTDTFTNIKKWFNDSKGWLTDIAIVVGSVFVPALITIGTQATIAFGKLVAQAAIAGTRAVISAVKTAGAWVLAGAQAAIAFVPVFINMAAGFIATGFQALIMGARMAAAWLIGMGPVGWIIAAVVAVAGLIIANWGAISKFMAELWANVSKWAADAWNGIKSVWGAVAGWFASVWNGITKGISTAFNAIVSFFKTWGLTILAVIFWPFSFALGLIIMNWKTIGPFFAGLWEGIKAIFSAVVGFVVSVMTAEVNALKAIWNGVVAFFTLIFGLAWAGIKLIWDFVIAYYTAIWNGIVAIFTPVIAWFSAIFTAAWNGIVVIWNTVGGYFRGVWNGIVSIFGAVGGWFAGVFRGAWDGIVNIFNGLVGFFGGVWGGIVGIFGGIGTAVGNAIGGAFRSVVNSVLSGAVGIINGFIGSINAVTGVINHISGVHIGSIGTLGVPKFASGVENFSGGMALVGERGPELVQLPRGSNVISNANSQKMAAVASGGGGGGTVNITINTQVMMGNQLEAQQFATKIYQQLQQIARRNGTSDKLPNIGIMSGT